MSNKKDFLKDITAPFDEIYIPSKGVFYPNKQESFLVKYLTAREENILTSPSLVESGRAVDLVLESCLLDWNYDIGKILVGDKNAILIYLRSTSFGDKVNFQYTCPNCNTESKVDLYLSQFEMKDFETNPDEEGLYTYTLPTMKLRLNNSGDTETVVVKFKPLTINDEKEIRMLSQKEYTEIDGIKIDNYSEVKYRIQIVEINGMRNKEFIKKVIKNMSLSDSLNLREYMERVEPGINNIVKNTCSNCGSVCENKIPINSNFFGLDAKYKENMLDEIFLISYYSKGGHSRDDIYSMPIYERRRTMEKIAEEVEKRNQAEKSAANKAKNQPKKMR
jgi:hypothetical protein